MHHPDRCSSHSTKRTLNSYLCAFIFRRPFFASVGLYLILCWTIYPERWLDVWMLNVLFTDCFVSFTNALSFFCSLLLWLAPLRIYRVGKNRVAHIRQHFLTHAICKPDINIYEPLFKCNQNGTQRCNPGWIEVDAGFFRHLSTLSSVQSLTELCAHAQCMHSRGHSHFQCKWKWNRFIYIYWPVMWFLSQSQTI